MRIICILVPSFIYAYAYYDINTYFHVASPQLPLCRGQSEAARSTGLSAFQTMFHVIWPQAFRRMIPPLGNQFIISLKDTSLLTVIGVAELTRQGQEIVAINFRSFEVWLAVAILYLMVTLSLSWVLRLIERRMTSRVVRRSHAH